MNVNIIKNQLIKEIEDLRDEKGFIKAGFPRFLGLFGRDSLITAWQLLDRDSLIAKNTLLILARLQGKKMDTETEEEIGKILHEYYPKDVSDEWWQEYKAGHKWLKRGKIFYMSADATPLFLIVLAKYFEKTKDKDLILKLWPSVVRALDWIIKYGDINKDGFLDYRQQNPHGLKNQSWKDSGEYRIKAPVAIVEIQGYCYLAFSEIMKIADVLGKKKIVKELEEKIPILKSDFNEKFWMKDKKYFALAIDGGGKQVEKITSNPGHLLFCGICDKEKEELVIKRLFQPDFWTPFGIRTHSMREKDFNPLSYHLGTIWPHDNWMIAQGLKELGYKEEYLKIKKALLKAYEIFGSIPELYIVEDGKIAKYGGACYPQAWAAGALLNFLTSRP